MQRSKHSQNGRSGKTVFQSKIQSRFGLFFGILPLLFFLALSQQTFAQCDITSPPQPVALTVQLDNGGNAGLSADIMVSQGINSSTCPYPVFSVYNFYDAGGAFIASSTFLSGPVVIFDCSDVVASPVTIFVSIDDDGTPGGNESSQVELSVTVEDNMAPTISCPAVPLGSPFSTDYDGMGNDDCRSSIVDLGAMNTTATATPAVVIPDDDAMGVNSTLMIAGIPAGAAMTDIRVTDVGINHTWVGDLILTLTAPNGEQFILMDRPGTTGAGSGDSSNSEDTDTYDFVDGADVTAEDMGQGLGGAGEVCQDNGICEYAPDGPPGSFVAFINDINMGGVGPNGTWSLNVSDNGSGDTGDLQEWTLEIDWTTSLFHALVADNCPGTTLDVNYANPADPLGASIDVMGVVPGSLNSYQFYAGTTAVTYTATDASGATATCSFDVTVADDELPSWDDPVPSLSVARQMQVVSNTVTPDGSRTLRVLLECQNTNFQTDYDYWTSLLETGSPYSGFLPAASDNCSSSVTVDYFSQGISNQACGPLDGEVNVKRRVVRTFSADDGNGNVLNNVGAERRFFMRVYVVDNTAPSYDPATAGVSTPTALSTPAPTPGAGPLAYAGADLTVNTSDAFNPDPSLCEVDMTAMGAPSMFALPVDCILGPASTLTWDVTASSGMSPMTLMGMGNDAAQIYPIGTHTIRYTAVDECGQTSTFTFDLVVVENTPPAITGCPANIAANTDVGVCEATVQWTNPVATDCSGGITFGAQGIHAGTGSIILIDLNAGPDGMGGILAEGDFPTGTTTVTYTFTDAAMNMATCVFDVVITDNENPTIAGCADQNINSVCPNATVPDYTGAFTLSDNCTGVTATQVPAAGTLLSALTLSNDVAPLGLSDGDQFTITITPTDGQGNTGTACTITATLIDLDEPIPAGPLVNISAANTLGADCSSLLVNAPTATDCNGTVIFGTPSVADGVAGPNQYIYLTGFTFVTWTYDDGNGNTATQSQTITVTDDTIDPTVNAGPDRLRDTDPGVCTKTMSIDVTEIFPTVAPYLDAMDAPGDSEAIDNCGIASLTYTLTGATTGGPTAVSATPVTFELGVTTVTYTATDGAGNVGTDVMIVTVEDNEPPVPTCTDYNLAMTTDPNDAVDNDCTFTIGGTNTSYDPTATDNCASPPTRTLISVTVSGMTPFATTSLTPGATSLAGASFTADPNSGDGAYILVWQFNDGNGQVVNCTQNIYVFDDENPTITCVDEGAAAGNQAERGVGEDGSVNDCSYTTQGTEFDPTTGDNCSVFSVSNDYNHGSSLAGATFPIGGSPYTVTWTVYDIYGNSSTCDIVITVTDDVPPTLACLPGSIFTLPPSNILTIDPLGLINPFFTGDVCSGFPSLSMTPNTFDCDDATNTPIPVVITATDASGNMATCNTTVTIQENVLPIAVCQDITIQLDAAGNASIVGADLDGGSSDNCTPAMDLVFTADITSFDCNDIGTQSVVMTVEDLNGFTASCTAMVTVEDNVDPTAVCQSVNAYLDAAGVVTVDAADFDGGSTDNDGCTALSFLINGTAMLSYNCNDVGAQNVTLEVTDASGNSATCNTTVVVIDDIAPTTLCQPLTLMLDASGEVVLPAIDLDGGSTDNCTLPGDLIFTIGGAASVTLNCDDIGENMIELTVTDLNGQSATCTSLVTVLPNEEVEITIQDATGGAGATLNIPVTIANALDVRSLQFTVDIDDVNIAEITNATSSLAGTVVNIISNSRVAFSFFDPTNSGMDFTDGDEVLSIEVLLVGMENDVTDVFFGSIPTPIQISQGCGLIPYTTTLSTTDGIVTIDPNSTVVLSGNVVTNDGDPVENVVVTMSGDESGSYTTDASGYYEFTVPSGSSVVLTPLSDMTPTQGVTSLDLAIIQAQIVVGGVLNNPYKFIAANPLIAPGFSEGISSADLALIQGAIVSSTPTFQPFTNSFRFVEAGYMFGAPTAPWTESYPQVSTLTNVLADNSTLDFIAIKMGDVNDTWPNLSLVGPDENRDVNPGLTVENIALKKGDVSTVTFKADNIDDLIAMQASFNFDTEAIKVIEREVGRLPNFPVANVGLDYLSEGLISLIWYDSEALALNQQEMVFSLEIEALRDIDQLSNVFALTDQLVVPQSYGSNTAALGFGLTFEEMTVSTTNLDNDGFKLLANRPNPFSDVTTVGFVIPEYSVVKLSIVDASGRVVWTEERSFDKGYQELDITSDELGSASGVFYFQLETADHTAFQKLIRIPN